MRTDLPEPGMAAAGGPVARDASSVGSAPAKGCDAVSPADSPEDEAELESKHFTSTRNACKLCTPLGACLAFRGVEGCIPFLHGSQGCSTYIRRYLISHFREPIDIASSNFHEESAIFGGSKNFMQGALNITRQYQPQLIGAATTCLAETIGEDMGQLLHDLKEKHGDGAAPIVHVSTASYRGTHIDGFHSAIRELVNQLAVPGGPSNCVGLFPGMVSAADLRHLKEILADFGLNYTLLPDYSESMDGETWSEYEKIQSGGTPIAAMMMSARRQWPLMSRVAEWQIVTVLFAPLPFWQSIAAMGLPTMLPRPRMTTSAPAVFTPERTSNSTTPAGVQGLKPVLSPSISLPTFTGWKPSTSLCGRTVA